MKVLNPVLAGGIPNDHFGKRMRAAREHAGQSRKEAAEGIGMSPAHLGRIERCAAGMVPEPSTLVRAARLYGVSDVWLYGGSAACARMTPDWYAVAAVA